MTQAYWEADAADAGNPPSNMVYTQPWNSWNSVTVKAATHATDWAYSLHLEEASYTNVDRRILDVSELSGISLADSANSEIYAVIGVDSQYTEAGVSGRAAGSAGTEYGVQSRAKAQGNTLDLYQYSNGTYTTLSMGIAGVSFTTLFAIRLRLNGTTASVKVWEYGTAEPVSWADSVTTSVTNSGGFGIFAYTMYGKIEVFALGVGTDGDAAPTTDVASDITGDGAVSLDGISVASTGNLTVDGQINISLADLTVAATGILEYDITAEADFSLDSISASLTGQIDIQFLLEALDLNLTIPHAMEDPDEQQKIIIENFIKIQQILRNLKQ